MKLTRSEDKILQWIKQPEFQAFKILGENFASISLHQSEVLWDKLTIVGACILDLAEKFVFDFHYNTMKRNFYCSLLYSDTDSFMYEIRSRDFFAALQIKESVMEQLDFSNFSADHPLHN